MDQAKIGRFISDMRKKQGLTQKQLADQLNVTDKTVSKWENGYRLPDASLLLELGSALEVDINELLAGEEFLPKEQKHRYDYRYLAEWSGPFDSVCCFNAGGEHG